MSNSVTAERSLADVLGDMIRNVQEIVRGEVRLAKAELKESARRSRSPLILVVTGGVTSLYALLLLLLSVVFALARIMPAWAAALIVGVTLAAIAGFTLTTGIRRFKQLHPPLERTVSSLKETLS